MSRIASILAGCVAAAIFSLEAQALPGSPAPVQVAAAQITLVKAFCGRGFHRRPSDGSCVPYAGPQAFGLPYIEPPSVRLPYLEPPAVRLPYAELPPVRLPYLEPPTVRLPYAELPPGRLPYVALPAVRLPYVEPPAVGLPYVELPVLGTPHMCPSGYSYYAARGRCVPL